MPVAFVCGAEHSGLAACRGSAQFSEVLGDEPVWSEASGNVCDKHPVTQATTKNASRCSFRIIETRADGLKETDQPSFSFYQLSDRTERALHSYKMPETRPCARDVDISETYTLPTPGL